jgi:hypothetical protein
VKAQKERDKQIRHALEERKMENKKLGFDECRFCGHAVSNIDGLCTKCGIGNKCIAVDETTDLSVFCRDSTLTAVEQRKAMYRAEREKA